MNPDAAADIAYGITASESNESAAAALLPYRRLAASSVQAAVAALDLSQAELLRQETVHSEALDLDLLAPAACLLTAEAIGGETRPAVPAATALALIESMGDVFQDIAATSAQNETLLTNVWGMPRALNAGDACYALAQQQVLSMKQLGIDDARVLRAAGLLDAAAQRVCEGLLAPSAGSRALLGVALALGALSTGASQAVIQQFEALGEALAAGRSVAVQIAALDLPEAAKQRLALLALATRT